jgi:hypothetical protein
MFLNMAFSLGLPVAPERVARWRNSGGLHPEEGFAVLDGGAVFHEDLDDLAGDL